MKITLILLAIGAALLIAYFVFLSVTAKVPQTGLVDGELRPCPGKPNCVCSDHPGEFHIDAIDPGPESVPSIADLERAVEQIGGEIKRAESDYIWATFKSTVFGFVDDLELRRDTRLGVVHVRSESRSGTSDLGVNRKRVEMLRDILSNQTQ